jgi:hypothetical protein
VKKKTTMVLLPVDVAADLIAGHVDLLWNSWANDSERPGCCVECCAPCHALKELLDLGLLDELYGHYIRKAGAGTETGWSTWDPEKHQVGRRWLYEAWGIPCNDHPPSKWQAALRSRKEPPVDP